MFDTMKIAAVIKQARIDRNMTQMNLADAMGVSYQAVSNWERGNSMPDIAKLEDLCSTLDITVEQLLGMENPTTVAVQKVIRQEELTEEELTEVAPALTPKELKKQMKAEKKQKKRKIKSIEDLAPFMSQEDLDELVAELTDEELVSLDHIAPFLSKEGLRKLADRCAAAGKGDELEDLAPFLGPDVLTDLMERYMAGAWTCEDISDLYPFLPKETLTKLARYLMEDRQLKGLAELMPFL